MSKANPHWRRAKYKNMFMKNITATSPHENEAARDSVRKNHDFKKNITNNKKSTRGFLSRREEEKYKDYVATRKQGIDYANEDNREKRNGIPERSHLLEKRDLNVYKI